MPSLRNPGPLTAHKRHHRVVFTHPIWRSFALGSPTNCLQCKNTFGQLVFASPFDLYPDVSPSLHHSISAFSESLESSEVYSRYLFSSRGLLRLLSVAIDVLRPQCLGISQTSALLVP